ncbi:MAG: hypothetical protein ACAH27_05640 [Xanthobacteraceae bacterium]
MSPGLTQPERLARLELQSEHHSEKLEEFRTESREAIVDVRTDIARVRADVSAIKEIMTEARGGWKVLVLAGGLAGFLGTVMMWFLSKFLPLLTSLPR